MVIKKKQLQSLLMFLIITCLLFSFSIPASASVWDIFTVDDITYKVLAEVGNRGTVEVSSSKQTSILGDMTITVPDSVQFNGKTYTVTTIGSYYYNVK